MNQGHRESVFFPAEKPGETSQVCPRGYNPARSLLRPLAADDAVDDAGPAKKPRKKDGRPSDDAVTVRGRSATSVVARLVTGPAPTMPRAGRALLPVLAVSAGQFGHRCRVFLVCLAASVYVRCVYAVLEGTRRSGRRRRFSRTISAAQLNSCYARECCGVEFRRKWSRCGSPSL